MKNTFKKGDKIIWDSFFGYELGYFIRKSDKYLYNSYRINLVTGIVEGETLRSKDEIIPYNEDTIKEMIKKYGYTKTF